MAKRPDPPKTLGAAGKKLWRAIERDLEDGLQHDARELQFLLKACRLEDEMVQLEKALDREGVTVAGSKDQPRVNPAVNELRQHRLAQLRLLGAIEMTDVFAAKRRSSTPNQLRARHAAETRWAQEAV